MAASYEERQKEEDKKKRLRRVYSTNLINQLIKDRSLGYDIDYDPFYMRDLDLRAPGVTFNMTPEEMEEYQKCYDDALYFVRNYCKFQTDNGMNLVDLRDFQEKIIKIVTDEVYIPKIDDFGPKNRNVIWMAARQSGKTTTIASFLSWMIIFHAHRNILVAANKEDTATEIVNKITNIFKGLPYFLKPGCDSFGKTTLSLENGSRILSTATTNTASIGFTLHCVLLDEFAHIPDNIVANFWRSVYPTLSSSEVSQCIITSTPNGVTNKFYDIWSKSVNHENSFINLRTDYWEVPGHDDAWAAKMRADFGDEEYAQEFELQFNVNSKMLLKAEDLKFLDRFKVDFVHKEIRGATNQYLLDENIKWHPAFDPNEIEENDKFIFLIDLAEGAAEKEAKFKNKKRTPDSNTINIFKVVPNSVANMKRYFDRGCEIKDAFRYIQVGKYECNTEDEIYCGNVAAALAYDLMKDDLRESVKIMVEMNFNGKSFVQTFMHHPNAYDGTILKTYHTKPIPGERQRRRTGFKTKADKEFYCIRGAKLINMKRIIVFDKDTYNQMQSFGYVKGKIEGIACHDDLSMPVFNHISRMLDEATYTEWLDDYFTSLENDSKKYAMNALMELYDMENPETSDSEFKASYGIQESPFIPSSEYAESINPYSTGSQISPYSSGQGGMFNPYSSGTPMTYSSLMR